MSEAPAADFDAGPAAGVAWDLSHLYASPGLAPRRKDLRAGWWRIADQGRTGACVGFATADGVLRYQFVKARRLGRNQKLSVRFIWMANKETDNITAYPTTFIETAGTQTKLALGVARKYGCVLEQDLPIRGGLSRLTTAAFYARAARYRISSYINLRRDLDHWRNWIANTGPILTRLDVDRTWDRATQNRGQLDRYQPRTARGGHAICLVGYTEDYFIVRNSWGRSWGHGGYAYASNDYAAEAFTEAYGAVL